MTAHHYIGPKIAHGLAQTPLATELIYAYKTSSLEQFQDYLIDFRESLKRGVFLAGLPAVNAFTNRRCGRLGQTERNHVSP